jgi:hypothetical protein
MDFIHRPKSKILKLKSTTFPKLALLPSSGVGTREEPTLWNPLDRAYPVMEASSV